MVVASLCGPETTADLYRSGPSKTAWDWPQQPWVQQIRQQQQVDRWKQCDTPGNRFYRVTFSNILGIRNASKQTSSFINAFCAPSSLVGGGDILPSTQSKEPPTAHFNASPPNTVDLLHRRKITFWTFLQVNFLFQEIWLLSSFFPQENKNRVTSNSRMMGKAADSQFPL